MVFLSRSEKETFLFAKSLASKIKAGDVFLIEGPLGAGKSVFVRGLASGLGITEPMPSPTFTIINEYSGLFTIYHFDFYRLNDPFELYEIGFEEYIYSDGISLIEWPSKAGDLIPENGIKVNIKIKNEAREIAITWNH
jgi:tRNA threonylcarbamoyladenosine biosynthesis protein TsaE